MQREEKIVQFDWHKKTI